MLVVIANVQFRGYDGWCDMQDNDAPRQTVGDVDDGDGIVYCVSSDEGGRKVNGVRIAPAGSKDGYILNDDHRTDGVIECYKDDGNDDKWW